MTSPESIQAEYTEVAYGNRFYVIHRTEDATAILDEEGDSLFHLTIGWSDEHIRTAYELLRTRFQQGAEERSHCQATRDSTSFGALTAPNEIMGSPESVAGASRQTQRSASPSARARVAYQARLASPESKLRAAGGWDVSEVEARLPDRGPNAFALDTRSGCATRGHFLETP